MGLHFQLQSARRRENVDQVRSEWIDDDMTRHFYPSCNMSQKKLLSFFLSLSRQLLQPLLFTRVYELQNKYIELNHFSCGNLIYLGMSFHMSSKLPFFVDSPLSIIIASSHGKIVQFRLDMASMNFSLDSHCLLSSLLRSNSLSRRSV